MQSKGREQDRLSRRPEAAMLLIAGLIVALIGAASYQESRDRSAAKAEQNASGRIHDLTIQLESRLVDAETGQRGYLITGRDEYLQPYHNAIGVLPGIMAQLHSASFAAPDLAVRVNAVEPLIQEKLRELDLTIRLRQTQGLAAAQVEVDTGRGKRWMDQVRSGCDEIRTITSRRSAVYAAAADRSGNRLSFVSTFGSLLLLGFVGLSAVTIFRGMIRREDLYREAHSNAELLRVTLTSIGDAVIATDSQARVTFLNPIARKLTAWNETEAIGVPIQHVFRIVNETTRQPVDNPIHRALSTGTVVGLANHTVLLPKSGSEVPIDDSGAPIRDDNGVVVGAVLVFRDISERRANERQLKESNEQLKQFVAAAAHDLRSPLNSSHAIAEVLAERFADRLGGEGNQLLGYITTGLTRMSHFLEDLLAYARATHFDAEAAGSVSLNAALRMVEDNLRTEIEAACASIQADALPSVTMSETHVVQLLQNLIGNALKYRSPDPPRIRVSAQKTGRHWTLAVSDNGIGIDPQFAEEIFKPFKRLHGHGHPGSGIGLATCRKIAAGYRGRIWVESTPGKGSVFFVTLPAAEESRAAKT